MMEKLLTNKKGGFIGLLVTILIALIIITLVIAYPLLYALTSGEETITVKEKWVKYNGNNAKYLVSSTNDQVFQITDSFVRIRFDSSNLYASLDEGECYVVKTQGWRFSFLSDYKNIIEVTKCE